jgi:two-component system copper resistance phosphate regulon response regulator CusR
VLDTAAQTAARGGKQIPLTTKEYALLEYLARNAGRVVGREEISEHVWDESFDSFTNTIEVYINRLRRKIDEPPAKPLIHTRRGAGYMLGDAALGQVTATSEAATRGEKAKASQLDPGASPAANPRAAGKKHV